jgi:hypothetical protein
MSRKRRGSLFPSWKRFLTGALVALLFLLCAVASFGLWSKHAHGEVVAGTVLSVAHPYSNTKSERYWIYETKARLDGMTYQVRSESKGDSRKAGDKISFTMTKGDRDGEFGDTRQRNLNLSVGFGIFALALGAAVPMIWRPAGGWRWPF